MSYEVILSRKSERVLKKAPPEERERLKEALIKLGKNPWLTRYKKLKGYPFYRIRVGDYRIIYSVDDESKRVYVLIIGKREGVYDEL